MKITIDGNIFEGTPEEIKEMMTLMGAEFPESAKVVEEEKTPTFKEGDRVKILAEGEYGGVDVGEIGTVAKSNADEGDEYNVRVDGEDDHDYFRPQDLELVTEEEAPRFKVGDSVRVSVEGTPKYFWGSVKNGDIGVIKRIEDDFIKVDFPSQKYWTALPSELALLTDEEVEQAKREDSFTKAGRKPGEFKKGDIVRVIDSLGGDLTEGDVYEISGIDSDGFEHVDNWYADFELIAPVESRVDL